MTLAVWVLYLCLQIICPSIEPRLSYHRRLGDTDVSVGHQSPDGRSSQWRRPGQMVTDRPPSAAGRRAYVMTGPREGALGTLRRFAAGRVCGRPPKEGAAVVALKGVKQKQHVFSGKSDSEQ